MASDNRTPLPFPCSQCHRKFETSRALAQHEGASHKVAVYQCIPCKKSFSSLSALAQHQEASHGSNERAQAKAPKEAVAYSKASSERKSKSQVEDRMDLEHRKPKAQHTKPPREHNRARDVAAVTDPNAASSSFEASDIGTAVAVGVGVVAIAGGIAALASWFGSSSSSENPAQVRVEEESSDSSDGEPILPNLVPKGAWGKKYKPHIPVALFDQLLSYHLKASGSACSFCGYRKDAQRLVLHTEWKVETEDAPDGTPLKGFLTFQEFQIVCWNCHDCKHSGWSQLEGRPCQAHMCRVNGWNIQQTESTIATHGFLWSLHQSLSPSKWVHQIDAFWAHPVVRRFLQSHPEERQNIRFGSLCLIRSQGYNQHPNVKHSH